MQQVYFPDVCAIGAFYRRVVRVRGRRAQLHGRARVAHRRGATKFDPPGGTILNGDLAAVKRSRTGATRSSRTNVTEDITHAYYDGSWHKHPYDETDPKYNA